MRVRLFGVLMATVLLGLAGPAVSAKVKSKAFGEMEEIFFLSGLEAQLEGFAGSLDASLSQQSGTFAPAQLRVLRTAVANSFAADELRPRVQAGLAQRYDARGASGTLAWLRSPLGRRITRLEEEHSTSDSMAELEAFANSLAESPPSSRRLEQIDALNRAIGAADVGVDLALTAALGVALGANASQPIGQRADEAQLRLAVQAQRSALAEQMQALLQLNSLKTYQSLSDDDLTTYLAFASSAAGQWYHEAVVKELVAALEEAAAGIGARVTLEMNASGAAASAAD
jgi:hypothetical protein